MRRSSLASLLFLAWVPAALADYEVPNVAYAPGTYYSGITATDGATLKAQLRTLVSAGSVGGYDAIRSEFANLDADPAHAGQILLAYNRASVDGTWDSGITYNREHVWVDSRLPASANGDFFNIRPCNPTINSTRNNDNYGSAASTGSYGVVGSYWFAGDADKGDVARTLFYMATRWSALTLVNGNTSASNQMGDLQSALRWNYQDGVDNFERRRNQVIYTDYQGNRNPFVDHPEYVWAVFGGGSNNSRLWVSTPSADGSSSADVNLGRVLKGATIGTSTATLNKTGTNPTTYNVATAGEVTTTAAGVGQAFDIDARSRVITVGLSSSTAIAGRKSGTVTIDNTDLTSSGPGYGSADGNDSVFVHADVLDHANASLAAGSDTNSISVDFGQVKQGATSPVRTLSIFNLESTASFTAGLDLDSIQSTGDTARFTHDLVTFLNLSAGGPRSFATSIDTTTLGEFSSTLTLSFSDENVTGATNLEPLSVTFIGQVVPVPEPTSIAAPILAGAAILKRRRTVTHIAG